LFSDKAVVVTIENNGITLEHIEVVVNNFHSGATAEIAYRINNATVREITPDIYLVEGADIADYSKG